MIYYVHSVRVEHIHHRLLVFRGAVVDSLFVTEVSWPLLYYFKNPSGNPKLFTTDLLMLIRHPTEPPFDLLVTHSEAEATDE